MVHVLYSRFTGHWRVCASLSHFLSRECVTPCLPCPPSSSFQKHPKCHSFCSSFPASLQLSNSWLLSVLWKCTLLSHYTNICLSILSFLDLTFFIEESQIYKYTNMGGRKCDAIKRQIQGQTLMVSIWFGRI